MGCASSKQARCSRCRSPYTPMPRSYSVHVHHPPQGSGDTYHVVALTSSTLGSIQLSSSNPKAPIGHYDGEESRISKEEFSMGVIEAKTWSSMIEAKIPKIVPKTPIRTPPGEPETINAWELMEGLEDTSPLLQLKHKRSFSFDLVPTEIPAVADRPNSPKLAPLWLQMADDDLKSGLNPNAKSLISDLDPDIMSTFKKALEELSPGHSVNRKVLDVERQVPVADDAISDPSFDEIKKVDGEGNGCKWPVHRKNKVVVYFTSLRGVRKTYEDCCNVRLIIKSAGFRIDERDVSMHSGFKEELKELLGGGCGLSLPRVFVGGRHIGGVEEVRRMHEDGQLEKALEGCETLEDGGGSVCEACGDVRFVPCETCSGSCKIYYDLEDEGDGGDEDDCGFRRCPDCNENGIRRCPICCD